MSVFADAEDALRGVDLAYNNFCRDFALGGKKVFFNDSMVLPDSQRNQRYTPDDLMQQLFYRVGEKLPSDQQMIVEHNPALRVAENREGLQAQLDYLSMKCGMGGAALPLRPGPGSNGHAVCGQPAGPGTKRQEALYPDRAGFDLHLPAMLGWKGDPGQRRQTRQAQITVNFDDGV